MRLQSEAVVTYRKPFDYGRHRWRQAWANAAIVSGFVALGAMAALALR